MQGSVAAATSLSLAGWCVILLVLALGLQMAWLVRHWRIGCAAPVDWRRGVLALPRRYLRDVHAVVARDKPAARMHALVAGGFLGGSALLAFGVLPRVAASHLFLGLVALNFAAMCAGAVMVGARRLPTRPARLSGGQFQVLPILLLAYGGGGAALGVAGLLGAAR